MRINNNRLDIVFVFFLILVIVGLPLAVSKYNHRVRQKEVSPGAIEFTLTGNAQRGWILGEVRAYDIIPLWYKNESVGNPVIKVSRGDRVVFRLRSSDVVHGFSFKYAGIFITDGIQPGKTILVSFTADRAGTFTFSCNAICGDNHKNMQGTLVVKA